jgi:hypothetical protein
VDFFIHKNGEQQGPYTREFLQQALQKGEFSPNDLAWYEGLADWIPLSRILLPPPPKKELVDSKSKSWMGITSSLIGALNPIIVIISVLTARLIFPPDAAHIHFYRLVLGGAIVGLLLIAVIGIFLGFIGIFSSKTKRALAITGLSLNFLFFASGMGIIAFGLYRTHSSQASAEDDSDDVTTRPIPIIANAKTQRDYEKTHHLWSERVLLGNYRKCGMQDPKWNSKAEELIQKWMDLKSSQNFNLTTDDLVPLSQEILGLGCNDPLIEYIAAVCNPELPFRQNYFQKSFQDFQTTSYPKILQFFAAMALADADAALKITGQGQSLNKKALDCLTQAFNDDSYQSNEMDVLLHHLLNDQLMESFFKEHGDEICRSLEAASKVDRWLTHTMKGHHYIDLAWKARGGGWANSVSEEGWKGMHDNLARAKEEFQTAYQLRPDEPESQAAMITVIMGSSKNPRKEMRECFDRAISAQIDYERAYHSLSYALWPRWHGSDEDILNLGLLCLNTERFETDVPYRYFLSLDEVRRSSNLESIDEFLIDPEVYNRLQKMFEGYIKEPQRPKSIDFYQTQWAIINYKTGNYITARKIIEELHYHLNKVAMNSWSDDLSLMIEEICAYTSPAEKEVTEAEDAYVERQTEKAIKGYMSALEKAKNDSYAVKFMNQRIGLLKLEEQLNRGDWTTFLPDHDFLGWGIERGQWNVLDDGSLEVHAGYEGMLMKSLARVGLNFEIKGEIEFVSSSNGQFQGGIVFGDPRKKGSDWLSFRIKKTQQEGEVAYFSENFYVPEKSHIIQFQNKNTFLLQSWTGKLNAYLNDKIVEEGETLPESFSRANSPGLIGFGGYYDQNETVVRFHNIQVRKLYSAPKRPVESAH